MPWGNRLGHQNLQLLREKHKYDASNFEYLDEIAQSFYDDNNVQWSMFNGQLESRADRDVNHRGRNGFHKDKGGEKLAETEEDLLEHRTDGTDAFDTLFLDALAQRRDWSRGASDVRNSHKVSTLEEWWIREG